jgi:ribosomal protein S18 acetylase RimI-like enzyme
MKYLNIKNFENYSRFLKVKHKIEKTLFKFTPDRWYPAQKLFHRIIEDSFERQKLPWFLVLKARQEGISTYSEARIFHLAVTNSNSNAIVLADNNERAQYIFDMCKTFYDYLPQILKPEVKYSTKKELVFDTKEGTGIKSSIRIATSFDPFVGQSMCLNAVHTSEAASFPYLNQVFTTLIPAVPHSVENTLIIIESTAKGAGMEFHQEWQLAKKCKSIFQAVFIPWFLLSEYTLNEKLPEYELFKPLQLTPIEQGIKRSAERDYNIEITPGQFAWRRFMIEKAYRGDEDGFAQEFPSTDEEAFIVTGNTAFNKKRLKETYNNRTPPKFKAKIEYVLLDYEIRGKIIEQENGELWIWKEPRRGKIYRIGVDPASGQEGRDWTAMQVIDEIEKEQVAEFQGYVDPIRTAHLTLALAQFYNNAKVVIEINYGLGCQVEAKRYYWNFYRHKYLDRITDKPTEKVGFDSTYTFKKELIGYGQYVFDEGLYKIHSERLIEELLTFVQKPGMALASAAPGCHDDLVMSFLIAIYTAYQDRDYLGAPEGNTEADILMSLRSHGVEVEDPFSYTSHEKDKDSWMSL